MRKKKQQNIVREKKDKKQQFLSNTPILHITLKSLLLIVIISVAIYYIDAKGYFNRDSSNAHVIKRWNSFYEFTKNNNVDILLFGDSHLFTGINPKNLSTALGVNAFLLAAPTTNIADTYFALKEALKRSNPSLVVIETYGINNFNPYKVKKGSLANQFRSFHARKDFLTKITSTPFLFNSDNYFYAWSSMLRNHDYIFNNIEQLEKNKVIANQKPKKMHKLYLGRFIRFQEGLDNSILSKYETLGAPVKGDEYSYSEYAELYVQKIEALCKERQIELMYLTIPMYYKHIDNYTAWKEKLKEIIKQDPNKWLDMQAPYDTARFTTSCFQNTYNSNQHLTGNGSLIATYRLVNFIKTELNIKLPNRKNETHWKKVFYGQEGYFENNPVLANDKVNQLLCENFTTNNVVIKEISIIKPETGDYKTIIAKIDTNNNDLRNSKLRLAISFIQNGQTQIAYIDLQYDILHEMADKAIYKMGIKPIEIKEVKSGIILYK